MSIPSTKTRTAAHRPHYSSVRPYTWKEADTQEHIEGIGIFKGRTICLHLTKNEIIRLATELIEHAENLEG